MLEFVNWIELILVLRSIEVMSDQSISYGDFNLWFTGWFDSNAAGRAELVSVRLVFLGATELGGSLSNAFFERSVECRVRIEANGERDIQYRAVPVIDVSE